MMKFGGLVTMMKEQGSNEKSALVKLRQDLGKVLMREGSNQFSVSLQIFCPTQDVFFFLSLELFRTLFSFHLCLFVSNQKCTFNCKIQKKV